MQNEINFATSQLDWLFVDNDRFDDGQVAQIEYDREGDMLEIFFAQGTGIGLELSTAQFAPITYVRQEQAAVRGISLAL